MSVPKGRRLSAPVSFFAAFMLVLAATLVADWHPQTVAAQAAHASASSAPQTTSEAWTGVVANYDDQDVTTFNTSTDQTQTIQLPEDELPQQVAISPDGKTAYVTSTVTYASVQPIDLTTNPATPGTPIDLANGATGIAITPNGSTLLVVDDEDSVVGINTTTDEPGTPIPIQGTVADVVVTPDGSTAWALSNTHSEVYLTPISLSTYQAGTPINVATIQSHPTSIALSPDGQTAYLASSAVAGSGFGAELSAIDLSTGAETDTYLSYLINAMQIVVSPNGQAAYISGTGGTGNSQSLVDVVDLTQNPPNDSTAVVVDEKPYSLAISPDGSEVDVASYHSNLIQVIDTSDDEVESETIPTGDGPQGIAITPDQAPVASLQVTPGNAGSPTMFDASASTVPYGSIVDYAWNFGDAQTDDTTTPTDTHSYSTPGSYTATVTETSSGGTSTTQTFTGHTVSNNGGPQAAASATFTVGGLPTTTTLTSSLNPSAIGQSVTLTATVAGPSGLGPPTGTVTFLDGSDAIDTATLARDGLDGQATYTTSSLAVGTHALTAVYGSTPNFSGSTSSVLQQVVNPLGSTTVTVDPSSTTYGATVTYQATVTGPGGTPTGTVAFVTGTTQLCTATLTGGTGSCTADNAPVGQDTVTGTYSGDGNYGSSSDSASVSVVRAPTTAAVSSSANPSTFGQSVTFTATVSPVSGVGTPTGTVTFEEGGVAIGTGTLAASGGSDQATFTTSSLTGGTHAITVVYGGDSNFLDSTSSPALRQVVNTAGGSTTVTVMPTSSTLGQRVTYQATVSGSGETPTGTVSFTAGTIQLCTTTLSGGSGSCTASDAPVGLDTVTGTYSGDGNYASSSGTATLSVGQASTTTAVSSDPDPSTFNQPVTLTAVVSGGTGVATPTGTVTFDDGGIPIGTGNLSLVGGQDQATFTISSLTVGTHAITAIYGGDGNFSGSSSVPASQVVNQGASRTSVSASPSSGTFGDSVTYRAMVTGPGGTPTGTVTFHVGTAQLCTATLSDGAGSCSANEAPAGTDTVTGNYSGDGTYASSSGTTTVSLARASSTTSLASTPNPSAFGQAVTFTATVSGMAGPAAPTGTVTFKDGTTTIGSGTLSAVGGHDRAAFAISSLSVGTHPITAVYGGDGDFTGSTSSPALQQVVGTAASTTTVTVTPSSATFGQSVTYKATVTGPGGTPGGAVLFSIGSVQLCRASLTGGSGSCTATDAPVGSDPITGAYSGDAIYASSSGTATLTVTKASTTTSVTSSVAPSSFGESVTFTATVSASGSGAPTGTVTFKDGTATIGSGPVSVVGNQDQATFSISSLSVGTHPITAVYGGDGNFTGSTSSPALQQVVGKGGTSTSLSSSVNPSSFGESVTFTATVTASGSGTPTGSATFKDGSTTIGSGTLSVVGGHAQATFAISSLSVGTHPITAVYGGGGDFTGSTSSPALQQVVGKGGTSTSLSSSVNPSHFGESVTFTATVTASGSGTPTGSVTFKDGTTTMGSGTVSVVGGHAQATFAISSLSVGTHPITAVYAGDGNFTGSTSSPALQQVVGKGGTSTSLSSSVNPSSFGESVTFTATVSAPGSGAPTGSATFKDGSTTIGSGTLSVVGGHAQATFAISSLSVGTHPITAVYGGGGDFTGSTSSPALQQVVGKGGTSTSLSSSVNPSHFGESVTFTATVTASGSGTPTGSVTFKDGTTTMGSGTVSVVGGHAQATFAISSLSVGTHPITAVYAGDGNFTGSTSSPALQQVVGKGGTSTSLSSSVNPSSFGESVTFTATVSAPGSGAPTGSVTFKDGSTTIGSGTLSVVGGHAQATFAISSLSVGTHPITAVYAGDGNFTGSTSSPALQQVVGKGGTSTSLSSSVNPSSFGESVTFTATVSAPGSGAPTGSVTFKDGSTTIGSGTLFVVGGHAQATFATSSLSVGTHPITAVYGGDGNFTGSTSSPALQQVVGKGGTSTSLSSSVNPSSFGESVTFTATVTASGSGAPTGTLTFKDGSAAIGSGTLSVVGGHAQATFAISSLSVGTHPITAVYGGGGDFTGSTSSPPLQQVVGKGGTSTSLSSSVNPSSFGESVTFTATVSAPGSGAPTGSVTFKDGTAAIGSGTLSVVGGHAEATLATSSLSIGTHPITAIYGGGGNFTGSTSSPALQQVVRKAASTTTATVTPSSVEYGQSVTYRATVTGPGGTPTGTVAFGTGSTHLCTATLAAGSASCTATDAPVGSDKVSGAYSGDPTYGGSSGTAAVKVSKAGTTTKLSSSANPVTSAQPVTLTATVSDPPGSEPKGTVTFEDGSAVLATGTLSVVGGKDQAAVTIPSLPVGIHSITAVYSGDADFAGSTSAALQLTVTRPTQPGFPNTGARPTAAPLSRAERSEGR